MAEHTWKVSGLLSHYHKITEIITITICIHVHKSITQTVLNKSVQTNILHHSHHHFYYKAKQWPPTEELCTKYILIFVYNEQKYTSKQSKYQTQDAV